ncbi:uncharacterized protein LOC114334259 [Diabrotica virgifera virgifera]|uniref:Uncharacterized protein LOC114334259 n=1 Tax=Diabrotica virgifera virgifera TaxID=50390 RepID=A0A6P7FZ53_DIAVI|nr:uncharacterized protein LOC114334259 [Diabrotica virgifera virgifera]
MLDVPLWILGVILLGIMGIIIFSVVMCLDKCGCDEGLQGDQKGPQNNVKGTPNDIFNTSLQQGSQGYDNQAFSQENIASTSAAESVHYPQLNVSTSSAEPTVIVDNNIEHKATVHSAGHIAETSFSEFVGENSPKIHCDAVGPIGFDFSGSSTGKFSPDDDVFHKNIDSGSVRSHKEIAGPSSWEEYNKNTSRTHSDSGPSAFDSGGHTEVRLDTGSGMVNLNAEHLDSDNKIKVGWNLDQPSGSSGIHIHHIQLNEAMHSEHDSAGYEEGVNASSEIAETSFSDVDLRDLNTYPEPPIIPRVHLLKQPKSANSEHNNVDDNIKENEESFQFSGHVTETSFSEDAVQKRSSEVNAANILTSRCESGEVIRFSLNDISLNLRAFEHNRDADSRQLAIEKAADLSTNDHVAGDSRTVSANINNPVENTSTELLPTNDKQLPENKGVDFGGDGHEAGQTKTVSADISKAVHNSDAGLVHTDDKQIAVNKIPDSGGDGHKTGEINSISDDVTRL